MRGSRVARARRVGVAAFALSVLLPAAALATSKPKAKKPARKPVSTVATATVLPKPQATTKAQPLPKAEPPAAAAPAAVVSKAQPLPSVSVTNLATGQPFDLSVANPTDKSLLLWFWAPN